MLDEEQISKVAAFAEKHDVIAAIYLFGSYASGRERCRSDVDLGVLFKRDVDGFDRIGLETELSNVLKKNVDLVDMRKSGPFLRHQIYKFGKAVYRDGTDYPLRFRAESIRDYLDTEPLRKIRKASLYGQ